MRNLVCHQDKMLTDIVSNCSQHRPKGILNSWGTNQAEGGQLASEMLLQCPSRSQYWNGSRSHLLRQEHPYPSFLLLKEGWMFGLMGNSGNINAHWANLSPLQSYSALWNHEVQWAAAAQAGQSTWALKAILMPIVMKGTHSYEVPFLTERSYIFSISRTQVNCRPYCHCFS